MLKELDKRLKTPNIDDAKSIFKMRTSLQNEIIPTNVAYDSKNGLHLRKEVVDRRLGDIMSEILRSNNATVEYCKKNVDTIETDDDYIRMRHKEISSLINVVDTIFPVKIQPSFAEKFIDNASYYRKFQLFATLDLRAFLMYIYSLNVDEANDEIDNLSDSPEFNYDDSMRISVGERQYRIKHILFKSIDVVASNFSDDINQFTYENIINCSDSWYNIIKLMVTPLANDTTKNSIKKGTD